jgi:5'-deoxynucleotidase YfbR-like HD superfamily hydrolase
LTETYKDRIDLKKTLYLALVHDDAEIVTGDIQAYYKDRMSLEELSEMDNNEKEAIEKLVGMWPKNIGGFSYRNLLYHALNKDCIEAQIVSYCDKVDAYCEALHEVFAGNPKFAGASQDYVKKMNKFPEKFPRLAVLLPSSKHPLLVAPDFSNTEEILKNAKFNTIESIKIATGLPHYDRRTELTINHFGFSPLVDLKES